MQSVNKRVACAPFKSTGLKPEVKGGLVTLKAKTSLEALTVLYSYPAGGYVAGDLVYVRGDSTAHNWAKDVYTVNDVDLIMVPEDAILLADLVGARPMPQVTDYLFGPKVFLNQPTPNFNTTAPSLYCQLCAIGAEHTHPATSQ